MVFSRMRLIAAVLAASAAAPALADEPEEAPAAEAVDSEKVDGAIAFAKSLTSDATAALTQEGASDQTKIEAFQAILADGLALDTIGRFMLGAARSDMTEAQNVRFNEVFPDYITRQYAEQFDEIAGKPLEVIDAKDIGRRDVIVRTRFARENGEPIHVDWRIRERDGERKAIDIIVKGVSIMLVKREEFSSFIASNGVDALLERLEAEASA